MNPEQFIARLRAEGVEMSAEEERLVLTGDLSVLQRPRVRAYLDRNRPAITAYLRGEQEAQAADARLFSLASGRAPIAMPKAPAGPTLSAVEAARQAGIAFRAPAPRGGLPFIDAAGELHIPLDTPPRYRWWTRKEDATECEALTLLDILRELRVTRAVWARYTEQPYDAPTGLSLFDCEVAA